MAGEEYNTGGGGRGMKSASTHSELKNTDSVLIPYGSKTMGGTTVHPPKPSMEGKQLTKEMSRQWRNVQRASKHAGPFGSKHVDTGSLFRGVGRDTNPSQVAE
jgi:hypothetical protein